MIDLMLILSYSDFYRKNSILYIKCFNIHSCKKYTIKWSQVRFGVGLSFCGYCSVTKIKGGFSGLKNFSLSPNQVKKLVFGNLIKNHQYSEASFSSLIPKSHNIATSLISLRGRSLITLRKKTKF